MSNIEKLLEGVEVEWKTLGDVADYVRGLTYNKSNESGNNTGYKVIRANNITLLSNTVNFDDIKYIKSDTKVKEAQKLTKNDILISAASGSREHVGKVAYIFANLDYYFGGFMGVVRCSSLIESRFLFHILTSGLFQKYLDEMLNSSTINNLSSSVMNAFLIPIPPISVQKEIVRLLDTFTERTETLINELTTELEARKKQYSYYREKLLSFEEVEVEWKTLGEVFDMKAGHHISASNIMNVANIEYQFPCFGGNGIRGYVKTKSHEGNHLLIGRQGALCGNVQRFDGEFYATEHAVVVTSYGEMNIDFAFHLLTLMNLNQYASKSAQPGLAVGNLERLKIPIPSKEEQERIVAILDKFESLTTSISEALPKEIALRKKQYEYYRDRLLRFE